MLRAQLNEMKTIPSGITILAAWLNALEEMTHNQLFAQPSKVEAWQVIEFRVRLQNIASKQDHKIRL